MKLKVDNLDRQIVDCLLQDGSMPAVEIARRLDNVSAKTVANRIDRLVQAGIIRVTAVVNRAAIGYPLVSDLFIETEPTAVRATAEAPKNLPEVGYIGILMGEHDLSVQVHSRDVEHLQNLWTMQVQWIPGVRRCKVDILAERVSRGLDHGLPLDPLCSPSGVPAGDERLRKGQGPKR